MNSLTSPAAGRRPRRPSRIVALLLSFLVVVTGSLTLSTMRASSAQAAGSTLSNETFADPAVTDARWIGLGDACLTAAPNGAAAPAGDSDLAGCTRTVDSPTDLGSGSDGYLQLTDNSGGRTGAVVYDRAFPNTAGLQVSFYEYQYATSGRGMGPADGIGFFLADGSYTLTKPGPQGAGYGGALGYASIEDQPGVQHGYLGVGLDVYGNYEAQPYVGTSCPNGNVPRPGSIGLRGPGNGTTGYCLLGNTGYTGLQNAPATAPGGQTGTPQLVTVTVSPTTADDPYPTITVAVNGTTTLSQKLTTPAPPTLKLGFTASTGGGHEVHLIRQVTVSSVNPLGSISLVKTVDHADTTGTPQTIFTEGDRVPYSFLVTNTGAEAVNEVAVADPKIADISCPSTALAPAAAMTCTGTYGPLTAADVASGSFTNTATVDAVTSDGTPVTDDSSAVIPTYESAPLSVTKRITGDGHDALPAGRTFTVDYSYPAGDYVPASTGEDGKPNGYPAGHGTLAVTADGTATTGARLPAGAVVTLAEASPAPVDGYDWGTPVFSDDPVTIGVSGTTAVTLSNPLNSLAQPALTVVKSASPNDAASYRVGQLVTYSFAVTNTGNVTLADVHVTDTGFTGTGQLSALDCPAGIASMSPGDTVSCTADYRLTQADVDAGHVDNLAIATVTPPSGPEVDSPPSGVQVPVGADPAISIVKTADPTTVSTAGQTVNYTFLVTNTSNVTLHDVQVSEDRFTGTGALSAVDCPATTLAPGGIEICTASYTVTPADIGAGVIDNTATAHGTAPGASTPVTSAPSSAEVTALQTPGGHSGNGDGHPGTGGGGDTSSAPPAGSPAAPSGAATDAASGAAAGSALPLTAGPRVDTGGHLVTATRNPLWWMLLGAPLFGAVIVGAVLALSRRRRS